MSTINSYFNTRKSRSNKNNSSFNAAAVKKIETTNSGSFFAAQAPQPIYEQEESKKPKLTEQLEKSTVKKNSILYYLSPIHNSQIKKNEANDISEKKKKTSIAKAAIKEEEEEEEEEAFIPCQIRFNIPVSHVWKDILQEFDPKSYTNQQDSPINEQEEQEAFIEEMDIITTNNTGGRRRKLEDEQEHGTRNVRIRSISYRQQQLNTAISLEDYLLEDIKEDLSRPLRTKYTTNQTNAYLLNIVNEVFILVDNSWFLQLQQQQSH